jgi:hypothetical protein
MKKGVLYLITVLIVFSGCSNFLGPGDPVQSRSVRPTPSDSSFKSQDGGIQMDSKPAKAAIGTPAEEDIEK